MQNHDFWHISRGLYFSRFIVINKMKYESEALATDVINDTTVISCVC